MMMNDSGLRASEISNLDVWTFDSAAAFWRRWETQCDDSVWARFSAAEQYLLAHHPRSVGEAAVLVSVLLSNADGPLEAAPLRRLHAFLTSLGQDVGSLPTAVSQPLET